MLSTPGGSYSRNCVIMTMVMITAVASNSSSATRSDNWDKSLHLLSLSFLLVK